MKRALSVLTSCYTLVGLIACISRWWWWQRHSLREGVPGARSCVHRRPGQRGEPGPLVGVSITSCRGGRWRWGSSDGASVPDHVGRRRRGELAALVWVEGPHSESFSNQRRGRRRRRGGDGVGAPVIVAWHVIRAGSEFLIVIDHPIAVTLTIATVRKRSSSRGRWRLRRRRGRRRIGGHAASVGRLRPLPWVARRIIASSAWRRGIVLLLGFPSRSAF